MSHSKSRLISEFFTPPDMQGFAGLSPVTKQPPGSLLAALAESAVQAGSMTKQPGSLPAALAESAVQAGGDERITEVPHTLTAEEEAKERRKVREIVAVLGACGPPTRQLVCMPPPKDKVPTTGDEPAAKPSPRSERSHSPKPVSRIVSLTDSHPVVTKLRQQFDVWVTADRAKHLKAYRSKLPVLIIEDGSPVSDALCSTFCQRMVKVSSASLPVVIGESSGDMMNANHCTGNSLCAPISRVLTSDDALTGTYSWLKGFQKCGGLLHGFLVYGSDNMSYNAYVSGIEAGCTLESKLRTAWKDEHTQLFLANSKDGSAGGTSNPCKRLTDNFIYLYSHAMDDVNWARKRASGKVKVSANIPERVAKVQKK